MTTALEEFRNGLANPQPFVEVTPRLITGAATAFGQSDVEGNVAFFNNLDSQVIGVENALEVPIGAGSIPSAFAITPINTIVRITTIVSQFPAAARIQYDGSGNAIIPLPGSYLLNFNFTLTVTTPSGATYYVQPYLFQNGVAAVGDTITVPNTLITAVPLSYNTLFFVTPAAISGGTNLIGVGVLVNLVATASITTVDEQIDYIGNMAGNTSFHPNMTQDVAILTDIITPTL